MVSFPTSVESFNPTKIYRETSKAVVLIAGFEKGQKVMSKGTGSIISRNGFVLTNAHVVIDKNKGQPFKNLRIYIKPENISGDLKKDTTLKYPAELIEYSKNLDLALLQIKSISTNKISKILKFSDSDLVSIGDPVVAIGHPEQGGLWTLTTGTISSQFKDFRNMKGKNVFQTETSLNRGNSGGPLINSYGHIVGVNSMISRKSQDGTAITGINFSIKSRVAVKWLNSIGLESELVSIEPNLTPKEPDANNAGIIPVLKEQKDSATKIETKQTPKPKQKKLKTQDKFKPKESRVLTKIRPYKDKELLQQMEDEMEDMMDEMKKNF